MFSPNLIGDKIMKIKETKVYQFSELSDEAKETAIENLADINVDHDWWDCTYEDAVQVKLRITGFDLDRNRHCTGEFIEGAEDTANAILTSHGDKCETYQTARGYLDERAELVKKYSDGKELDVVAEDNEWNFDNDCDELDAEFLRSILEDYSIILQKEYEYLTSEEAIIETIKANEYEFDENGKLA